MLNRNVSMAEFYKRIINVQQLFVLFWILQSVHGEGNVLELCIWEVFKPECSNGEIVMVKEAKYGRMKINRCLTEKEMLAFGSQAKDPRYFGCYKEVTDIINEKCLFKRTCEMKVGDLESIDDQACFPGLKMHLEVDYKCLPVIEEIKSCEVMVSSRSLYLNPSSIKSNSCGSQYKALKIEASNGQTIMINHHALKNYDTQEVEIYKQFCKFPLGSIVDNKGGTNVTVCENGFLFTKGGSTHQSMERLYISKGNIIAMMFQSESIKDFMLLELKADGCLDIIPPEDSWLKRNNDDIVIGCYSSKQTWYLRCENRQWIGTFGNCSNPDAAIKQGIPVDEISMEMKTEISSAQQILVITAICGFGIVVCFAIICIGFLCLRSINSKNEKNLNYGNINSFRGQTNSSVPTYYGEVQNVRANDLDPSFYNFHGSKSNGDPYEDERYQVLDKDEVGKESVGLV